jgi:hypothetical protein
LTLVAPEHRPTLREELAPLPSPARWAVVGVLAVLLVGVIVATTGGSSAAPGKRIVRKAPVGAPRAQGAGLDRRLSAAPARLQG